MGMGSLAIRRACSRSHADNGNQPQVFGASVSTRRAGARRGPGNHALELVAGFSKLAAG